MTLRAMQRELERLEKNKEEVVEMYKRAHEFFKDVTTRATGEEPGSKVWTGFYNAAIWEWFHHAWIVSRGESKDPRLEKG